MASVRRIAAALSTFALLAASAHAQADPPVHDHSQMTMPMDAAWTFMQDGIVFAELNHQGSERGGTDLVAPNWWMGMASRDTPQGRFTFTGMVSLDPATVGKSGYRELFQSGEALNGQPNVDRQHPHDLFMQLAAIWRMPVTSSTGLTIAGGPVGEPALGPVAFMHRASAMDNPAAPLAHHTLDSSHVAFGVVTAAVDHGPLVVEGSIFNGREPDENRWDFDFGRLDSYAGRVWYRPNAAWEFQASAGHLTEPEALEPGQDITRTTFSASWMPIEGADITAITVAFGHNATAHGGRSALLLEGARRVDVNTFYGRIEAAPAFETDAHARAVTIGGVHDVLAWRGFEGGVGADVTLYGVPDVLQASYGSHPVSFHVFFRVRPPAGPMGRMWNMRMSQPMNPRM